MRRVLFITAVLLAQPALADEPVSLKPGPDAATVAAQCSVCHTLAYIRMNSPFLTKDDWTNEVHKMQKSFGAPIDDATAASIINYLAATYGPPKS